MNKYSPLVHFFPRFLREQSSVRVGPRQEEHFFFLLAKSFLPSRENRNAVLLRSTLRSCLLPPLSRHPPAPALPFSL